MNRVEEEEEDDDSGDDWDISQDDHVVEEPNYKSSKYRRNIEVGMGGRVYHYADSEDDMESDDMEAGYSDIQIEEEEAQRIADEEDEMELKAQKEEKKRKKYRKLLESGKEIAYADVSSEELSMDEY